MHGLRHWVILNITLQIINSFDFIPKEIFRINPCFDLRRGTRWRSWLRHCVTSRKVAGSIHDDVTGIFHWHNPSGRTMALGSTQPLTEMSTRSISCGVKTAGAYGWQPYYLYVPLSWNTEASNSLKSQGLSRTVIELLYLLRDLRKKWKYNPIFSFVLGKSNFTEMNAAAVVCLHKIQCRTATKLMQFCQK